MKDPWCSNHSQLLPARSDGQSVENRERGAIAWFAPRWFLPAAVLSALIALTVFSLSVAPGAASETSASDGTLADYTPTGDTGDDDTPVTLPDNLSATVSKGETTTDTGPSSKVTIAGDCPPDGGGLRLHMKKAGQDWPLEEPTEYHIGILEVSATFGCGESEISEISVDGIAPAEEWDLRVYAWRDGNASDFKVYNVVGWSVPGAPASLSITSSRGELSVSWDEVVAIGTAMPVTPYIRWRTAPVIGGDGAGPWNAEDGVATDTPTSHVITGLANGTFYDVEVKAVSPMGSSEWADARYATLSVSVNAITISDTTPVTLPDNLSVTVAKDEMTTDTVPSSKVVIMGDCPPNGGGLRLHMVRAGEEWPAEEATSYHRLPDAFPYSETLECGDIGSREITAVSVYGIAPGEKLETRVYVWRSSDGEASDFSQVYYLFGWTVPDAPTNLSVTPGKEQLAVTWDEITALGTGMPVNTHIRWRRAQLGDPGEAGYAASGQWNEEGGVPTDWPASHIITGLATGAAYDVEVRAASPMGSSEWSKGQGETLPSPDHALATATSNLNVTFGTNAIGAKTYTAETRVNKLVSGDDIPRLPEVTVDASGDTLYWDVSYSVSGLPPGLSMGSDRVIRGTPGAATGGAVTVTYTANVTTYEGTADNIQDGETGSASLAFEVTVNPAVAFGAEAQRFINSNIIAYTPGQGWENAIFPEAEGGTGTLTYSLVHESSGQPLADHVSSITFDASTRTIGGTVASGERYAVTFIATDRNGAVAQGYTEVTHREGGL